MQLFLRAIDGARTRGLDLGKVARYQLRHYRNYSFCRLIDFITACISACESDRRGSNPRSRPWQGRALPTTPLSHLYPFVPHEQYILYCRHSVLSTTFSHFLKHFFVNVCNHPFFRWRSQSFFYAKPLHALILIWLRN